ncbi:MAG: DUF1559 domain-containing protein, partial [Chlorobiales bacterium]|nr:DUF1559 domain-containing protein [Chlorobiales bacterium]
AVAVAVSALPVIREAARRSQCENNLRQLGVALHGYHGAHAVLPPAAVQPNYSSRWVMDVPDPKFPESTVVSHANWVMLLLPHLGEDDLAASFDMNRPISDPQNARARITEFPLMKCPVDTYHRSDNPYVCPLKDGKKIVYARGNYAINGGTGDPRDHPGTTSDPHPSSVVRERSGHMEAWWGNGVAGFNKSFTLKDFDNGLATTVALEEIRAGIAKVDSRGVWALGQIGPSVTFAHGLYGDAVQPNNRWHKADDILGCTELYNTLGRAALEAERMGCAPGSGSCRPIQATARSMHPGGVNVLMMDGATRFVVDDVDVNVWHVIHSRKAREEISLSALTRSLPPVEQGRTFPAPLSPELASALASGEIDSPRQEHPPEP